MIDTILLGLKIGIGLMLGIIIVKAICVSLFLLFAYIASKFDK